jgi:hypothetical protein
VSADVDAAVLGHGWMVEIGLSDGGCEPTRGSSHDEEGTGEDERVGQMGDVRVGLESDEPKDGGGSATC